MFILESLEDFINESQAPTVKCKEFVIDAVKDGLSSEEIEEKIKDDEEMSKVPAIIYKGFIKNELRRLNK